MNPQKLLPEAPNSADFSSISSSRVMDSRLVFAFVHVKNGMVNMLSVYFR